MGSIDPALSADGSNLDHSKQIPPISQAVPQGVPAMQTLQPQHPDQYRALPPPPSMYPPYHQQPQMGYPPAQPAPRQRTAIACRYCRRRKIRCSGFDQSEDGRCTNCQRFSQECVFTPVSAQTQAFVPAHTVWRGQQPPANTQLYGAYGQPLPPHGRGEQYQQSPQQPGQYPPPPQGYQQPPPMYGQPPPPGGQVPQQQTPGEAGRKRPTDEPHTPTLPPPNPALQGRVGEAPPGYAYPDPTGMNPGGASYYPPPAPHHHHPSHPPAPPHYQPQMQPHAYPPHLMPPQPPQGYPAAYGPHPTQHSVEPNVHLRASRSVPAMVATKRQEMIRNKNASPSAASNARQDERSPTDDTMVSALSRGVDRR